MKARLNMIKESLINILVWGLLFFCAGSVFVTLGVLVVYLIDWLIGLLWKALHLTLDEPVNSNYLLTKIAYLLTWLITVNTISFTTIILILLNR